MSTFFRPKGVWSNRAEKLGSLVRKITAFVPKYESLSTSSLNFDSYCESTPNERVYAVNRRIDSLIKSGRFDSAQKVFEEMPIRDVVTYNLMISGHRRYGHPNEALRLYAEMVSRGIRESALTFSSVLGICSDVGFYELGIQIHCRAALFGLVSLNAFIGTAVINLHLGMGRSDVALKLFDGLPERNLATWNMMLRWFCEEDEENMLVLFVRMRRYCGSEQNGLTFSYLIRGCGNGRLFDRGRELHCHVIKLGWVSKNVFVANALVDFYSACESSIEAKKAFREITEEDVISWNSIVWVCANNGLVVDCLKLFSAMRISGNRPSIRSITGLLGLAGGTENAQLGRQVHSYAVKSGFDRDTSIIGSALIHMYSRCREIGSSVAVYSEETRFQKSLECSNSLMMAFLRSGLVIDAIEMFGLVIDERIGFDGVTLSTALKAAKTDFESLHTFAVKSRLGSSDAAVSCSLIDAYSKSGRADLARRAFNDLRSSLRNATCFTAMINGYARNGFGEESLELFRAMIGSGLRPDRVTLLCVLSGCSHSGLVREGKIVFESMEDLYCVSPDRRHYSCMVDLLGRAGFLNEAEELMVGPGRRGDSMMWSSLLRSCRAHKNERLGRRAANILLELEPENPAILLQVSGFYSEIGEFSTATEIRERAMARKVMREIGYSFVD